jgi:hypothetical protein
VKNPSLIAAFLLVGLALIVGGVAVTANSNPDEQSKDPALPELAASGDKATFENLSPHEARKKGRLEAAERELDKVKKIGKEVRPNVYKVKDDTGDPTYYYGSLIKGVGRNGEPLYLTAQFKRLPAPPLKQLPKLPPKLQPKLKKDPIHAVPPPKKNGSGNGSNGPEHKNNPAGLTGSGG